MSVTEMTWTAGRYDYTLTLLMLPEAQWQEVHHDEEEALEDSYDHFIRNGQCPGR